MREPMNLYHFSEDPDIKIFKPIEIERVDDLIAAILEKNIELRVTPSLFPLKKCILESTMNFSMIRMRNAVQENEFENTHK
ncbi:DUF6886 family protein [Paenibacillus roseipurpureus]|uniref:DUF6886 family protein n=1 Tax=Paenibacillus roseopurpureus TaxID=2918901 RepID=UPI0037CAE329